MIDAHQHFWKYNPAKHSWITNEMSVLKQDYLIEKNQSATQNFNIEGCIAVQADESEEENYFLLKLASSNDYIKGIVGWLDFLADDFEERISHYFEEKMLKGFRYILQDKSQRDLMLQPIFQKNLGLLCSQNFTYDILIFPDQLHFAIQLVKNFPNQKFVINHLAKPYIKAKEIEQWKKDMIAIAKFENVHCKISGIITEADWKNWKKEDVYLYLDVVAENFKTDRMMYGSDFPVCLLAGSYQQVLNLTQEYFSEFSENEKEKLFKKNAIEFYNL